MPVCPSCGRTVLEDWKYCFYCSEELISPKSMGFAYDQLYDLMKQEEARREYLDTKAGIYIGLLGLSVTILTAFGGIITIRGGKIQEINDNNVIFPQYLLVIIYVLYFTIVILFIAAVIFAFRAYGTGSALSIDSNSEKGAIPFIKKVFYIIGNRLIPRDDYVYKWIDRDFIAQNKDCSLVDVHRCLADHINNDVLKINYYLNNKKSNRVIKSYVITIFAVFTLLILVILIGAIGIGLL
ncbi:MAG: hypothetical protein A4E49_03431 [Methanosaeta sp. PtaU1.Bin112]|nr:MAG: hypothetical protein A4E49_03431 [Methanosaeta sp. PtaU1.Bin112]